MEDNLDQLADQARSGIMTSFEIAYSSDEQESFDTMKGFFEAEVDGKYQF